MVDILKLTNYKFDYVEIKKDVDRIREKYNIPQIGLTHSTREMTSEERILECTGSIYDYESKSFKFKETDFTIFNKEFENTALHEMYKSIPNIGRFRIMTMTGPSCYTIHKDLSMRYHYVIETNPNCIFLFPGVEKQYHIPCDHNLYLVDTRYKHTFVNGSKERRIHLVLDDLSTLK